MAYQNSIDTAYVNQYGKTLDLVAETKGGKFNGLSLEDQVTGEVAFYDQLDSVYAGSVDTSANSGGMNSPDDTITHLRRRVELANYEVGILLDRFDKVQTLINPESEYVQRQVSALMRKKDIEFIKGALGGSVQGKDGTATPTQLGSGQKIANGNTGLTIAKIREARAILQKNGVDLDDPINEAYLAVTPTQIEDLLGNTEATSADFMNVKALVSGGIDTFYGFKIIVSNLLPFVDTTTATNEAANLSWSASDVPAASTTDDDIRGCFAWVKSGIRSAVGMGIETDIAKRADKRFNWYAYSAMRCGAVRMEEEKVVQIGCDETVD